MTKVNVKPSLLYLQTPSTGKLSYHFTGISKMVYHFRGLTKMILCTMHLALCTILITSCRPTNSPEGNIHGEPVTFSVSLLSISRDSTFTDPSPESVRTAGCSIAPCASPFKAADAADISLSQANMTDLWLFEGTTLLCHQTSGSAEFGSPQVELSYGHHTITFIASPQPDQTFTSGTWHAGKAADTFGYVADIDVTTSASTEQIILNRLTYGLKWQSTDLVPSGTKTLRLSVSPMRESLQSNLVAVDGYERIYTYDVSSYIGRTISVAVYGLPAEFGEEDNITTTISFLDATGSVLFSHTTTVPVLSNRRTIITGALFNSSASTPIRINSQWLEDYETSL